MCTFSKTLTFGLCAMSLVACNQNQPSNGQQIEQSVGGKDYNTTVIAQVGDLKVSTSQLLSEVESMPGGKQRAAVTGGYQAVLNRIIDLKIVEEEAQQRNLQNDPDYLQHVKIIEAKAEREKKELLKRKLYEDISKGIQIAEDELKAYYDTSKNRFLTTTIHLNRIVVGDEAKAKEIKALIDKGEDFKTLAGEVNVDSELKANKGDMGVLERSEIPRQLRVAAFSLQKPNEVSAPFFADNRWNLLQLVEKKSGVVRSFDTVRLQLEKELRRKKSTQALNKLIETKKAALNVQISKEELAKLGPLAKPTQRQIDLSGLKRENKPKEENEKIVLPPGSGH